MSNRAGETGTRPAELGVRSAVPSSWCWSSPGSLDGGPGERGRGARPGPCETRQTRNQGREPPAIASTPRLASDDDYVVLGRTPHGLGPAADGPVLNGDVAGKQSPRSASRRGCERERQRLDLTDRDLSRERRPEADQRKSRGHTGDRHRDGSVGDLLEQGASHASIEVVWLANEQCSDRRAHDKSWAAKRGTRALMLPPSSAARACSSRKASPGAGSPGCCGIRRYGQSVPKTMCSAGASIVAAR
jgi:hypothetical protein